MWPAGRMVAYASDRAGGGLDIWVQHLDTNETRRLTTHPADESEPSFSPDGTRIAYYSSRDGGGIYTVSTLGGEERKIAQGGRGPRFSPDGKWIGYWTGTPVDVDAIAAGGEIFVVPAQGGEPRRWPQSWCSPGRRSGRQTASGCWFAGSCRCTNGPPGSNWYVAAIDKDEVVPVLGREDKTWQLQRRIATWWEGNRIYFSASTGDARGVWALPIDANTFQASGPPERLPIGSVSAEDTVAFGTQLVYTDRVENPDIWMLPIETDSAKVKGEPKRLTTEVSPEWNCGITEDGTRLVYVSQRSGDASIHLQDLRSGQKRKLLEGPKFCHGRESIGTQPW